MNQETPHNQDACRTAELLLHVGRLVHGAAANPALTPAQWTALRYFASANQFSRTPSGFSEFNATTRGTASQTVKALIAMGLLEKRSNAKDARSTLIEVTEQGHALLDEDPLMDLTRAIEALPPRQREVFAQTLTRLGSDLAHLRSAPTFGKCNDCGHCETNTNSASFCRCTQTMLEGSEMNALCVDFAPKLR